MSAIQKLPEIDSDFKKLAFTQTAMMNLVKRLESGDFDGALSLAKGCLIGLDHGSNSSEFRAYLLTEEARFKSMNSGGPNA